MGFAVCALMTHKVVVNQEYKPVIFLHDMGMLVKPYYGKI
jgi:hypothetical protein